MVFMIQLEINSCLGDFIYEETAKQPVKLLTYLDYFKYAYDMRHRLRHNRGYFREERGPSGDGWAD